MVSTQGKQTLALGNMTAVFSNILDLVLRQGPYISVRNIAISECSLNRDRDWHGVCSDRHKTNGGSGDPLGYQDHQTLWQVALAFKNSGAYSFTNASSSIEVDLKYGKSEGSGSLTPIRVFNVTYLDTFDSYYTSTGRKYGIMNEFNFTVLAEGKLRVALDPRIFTIPYAKRSTDVVFLFRDLNFRSGDSLIFNISLSF